MTSQEPVRTRPARRAAPKIGRSGARVFERLARKTKYVDPGLAADWPQLIGEELARLCRPGRLSGGRVGRTLEVVAPDGGAAARVQFEAERIRHQVNAFLGPGAVARILVRRADGGENDGENRAESRESGSLGSALSRFRASVEAKRGRE